MVSLTAAAAVMMAVLMLGTGVTSVASATDADPMDRIRLEKGTTDEFGGGDFVAVNMTDGDNHAWFGVVYGTEERPAPPTLVGVYIRYLGGAEVRDANGGMMIPAVPIPVVTVFFQQLDALIEFNDTGYIGQGFERYGAGNGLFDFAGNRSLDNFGIWTCEPVYKMVDLRTAWELSDVTERIDEGNGTKSYDFALTARDLTYTKIWDDRSGVRNPDGSRTGTLEDGSVAKVEFQFHVDATALTMEAQVPWYEVKVDGTEIVSSRQVDPKAYTGVSVDASFKYDHIIEGWDYTSRSESSRLMLENVVFFGTFIPQKVQEWMDAQFLGGDVGGEGTMEFQPEGASDAESEVPSDSTRVAKNRIQFRDNWQRVGALEWVSNVIVDGEEDLMYYQIHAGSELESIEWADGTKGEVKGVAVIGGYIYPAGSDIYHDPTFAASTFMAPIIGDVNPAVVLLMVVGAVAVCGICAVSLLIIRQRGRRRSERFQYQVPPEYRRP